jgi:hypothetical protein
MSLPAPQVGQSRVTNVHHYLRQLSRLHPLVIAVLGRYLPGLAMQDGVFPLAQRHQMRNPRTVSQPVGCFTGSRTCAGRDTVSTPASPATRPLTAGSRQICHPAFYVPEFAERCKSERSRGAALRLYRSSSLSSPPAPGVAHIAPSGDTSQARRTRCATAPRGWRKTVCPYILFLPQHALRADGFSFTWASIIQGAPHPSPIRRDVISGTQMSLIRRQGVDKRPA